MNDSFDKIEPIKRSNSMFLHPSPDIDIKVIKQIGDYSLGTELGSGAFGKVVLGKHILTNELVAIKILDKMILSHTPDDYQSVKQEINILKSVKHKHIVQLYEVLQTSRHIFIIMEYCEGKDLLDYILTKSKLSEEESLKYFQQLINALFYLHSQNIAHRDIKIDNMLLDRNRDLKLVDFGLSTKYPDDNLLDQPCGTVVYAAPEVLQGREYHGMLADVWSSGIVLYGMLSGYLPFGEQDDEINRQNIIMGRFKFPPYFSDCVKDLLMHMLDLDPMTRYTLQEVRNHPWFSHLDYRLIPGIIIGYNVIPVDEKILNLCVTYNCDKEKVRDSVINNKYNSDSALYYLLIKKLQKKGFQSVSDFCSDEFISFVLDDNNLISNKSNDKNFNKIQDSEIKYNININANNNCSAPPDGKIRCKENKKEDNKNNNLITPKMSQKEFNINKKINFDETPKGVLSYILNTSSFKETNKELFNIKSTNSIDNKKTKITNNNIDNESKRTNKNTSSDSKPKDSLFQPINVNHFEIIDDNKKKNIIKSNIFEDKLCINNIFMDENFQRENDFKMYNIIYKNTDNNEKIENEKISIDNNDDNIIKRNIFNMNINNNEKNLNMSNNNINNNSKEKYNNDDEVKIRNNADIFDNHIINKQGKLEISDINNISIKSVGSNKDNNNKLIGNNEFIIETPDNKEKKTIINKTINVEYNTSRNKNTLSKQKVYIDKNKTLSERKKNQNKKKLNINKIKDIIKINLFQEEIKEEENNQKDKELRIIGNIKDKELNSIENKNEIEPYHSNKKKNVDQISISNESCKKNETNELINNNIIITDISFPENKKSKDKNINDKKDDLQLVRDNNDKLENNININIEKIELINGKNIKEIKIEEKINKNNNDINKVDLNEKSDLKNNDIIKKEIKRKNEVKNISPVDKNKKKNKNNNNKITKKNKIKTDARKKKIPVINSILKNYKAIIDTNKSLEIIKNKKSNTKEKNKIIYTSKNRKGKNSEKEIASIKIFINKDFNSKEKNKIKNNIKNRTERPENKIKSIYRVNILPNNLSKNKYSTINKNITISSINKNEIIKIFNTNKNTDKKYINDSKMMGSTNAKSSSSCIISSISKIEKNIKSVVSSNKSNSKSIFRTNNLIKSKNKKTTNSKFSKNNKLIENNLWIKSYNNKYMQLFKSTQYKNDNILFKNKIDKTNLNKKFDEIAHKVNKSTKYSNNKYEDKKIPLWKYIQSDQYDKYNTKKNYKNYNKISSSPYLRNNEIKKNVNKINKINIVNNINTNKIIKNKKIKKTPYEYNTIDKIFINKNIILKDKKINININKINNNCKSQSTSKDKNINVFFINIQNYINNKNRNNKRNPHDKKYFESSVINQRYKSPYDIRDLSESVKNKYLNQKTRYTKIPWKIKKKAIDEKRDIDYLYNFYFNKNKNPFKNNDKKINKKIYNIKPINNKNQINNQVFENNSLNNLNRINNFKKELNYKQMNNSKYSKKTDNIGLVTNKKVENLKNNTKNYNNYSYTPQYIHRTKNFYQRNIFPNKLFILNNYREINNNSNNKDFYKNYSIIFDLSCLFMKCEKISDCYQNLINKLKKKNISFVQKPNKAIRCFKNGYSFEIEIIKIEDNYKSNAKKGKNIFCFKIKGKNGEKINELFKNIILDQK